MHEQRRAEASYIHASAHAQHEDDREFKSLALMRRHDAHDVLALADGAGAHAVAARLKPLRIGKKRMQRSALRLHEHSGPRNQKLQIGLPRGAARQRAWLRKKSRLCIVAFDQAIHALMART